MKIYYPRGWENFRRDTEGSGRCQWTSYGVLADAFEDESAYPPEIMNRIVQGLGWLAREHRWPGVYGWGSSIHYESPEFNHLIPDVMFLKRDDRIDYLHSAFSVCHILSAIRRFTELSDDKFNQVIQTRMINSDGNG